MIKSFILSLVASIGLTRANTIAYTLNATRESATSYYLYNTDSYFTGKAISENDNDIVFTLSISSPAYFTTSNDNYVYSNNTEDTYIDTEIGGDYVLNPYIFAWSSADFSCSYSYDDRYNQDTTSNPYIMSLNLADNFPYFAVRVDNSLDDSYWNYISNINGGSSYFMKLYLESGISNNFVATAIVRYTPYNGYEDFQSNIYTYSTYLQLDVNNAFVIPTINNGLNFVDAFYINVDIVFTLADSTGGYQTGYDTGYTIGYNDGNGAGYSTGYNNGYNTGFENGSRSGTNFASLLFTIADVPIYYLKSLFNIELFGVKMYTAVMSLLTIMVITFIVKRIV